jgi:hypothetical protein
MAQERRPTRGLTRPRLPLPHGFDNNSPPDTASTAEPSISHASDSLTITSSNGDSLELSSSATSSDSLYSATSKRFRAHIKHLFHDLIAWRPQYKADPEAGSHPGISWPSKPSEYSDESLIAGLDVFALSRAELQLLKRMENVCRDARATRESRRQESVSYNSFDLHLRGGGGEDDGDGPRRRTTLPPPPNTRTPRQDSERPNSVVWWLAGGKRSRGGQVPTIGELRVRKEVEQANRRIVGFWGAVTGLRRVGKVGLLGDGGGGGGSGGGEEIEVPESGNPASVKSASVHAGSTRSVGSGVHRAVGVDDGGDETNGPEAVADAIGNGFGSVKDPSVHGGSAKSVEKCEPAQEQPQDNDEKKDVDGHDIAEGPTSVRDNNPDEHSGETEITEAVEAAEDDAREHAVDDDDENVAEEPSSAKSMGKDSNREEHSSETEAREAASAAEDEAGEKAVDSHDVAEESNSAKSQKEDNNRDKHSGETEAREAATAADDDASEKAPDVKDVAEESSSTKSLGKGSVQDEHSAEVGAREAAEAA